MQTAAAMCEQRTCQSGDLCQGRDGEPATARQLFDSPATRLGRARASIVVPRPARSSLRMPLSFRRQRGRVEILDPHRHSASTVMP